MSHPRNNSQSGRRSLELPILGMEPVENSNSSRSIWMQQLMQLQEVRDLCETLSQLPRGLFVSHSSGLVSEPSASYQLAFLHFTWAVRFKEPDVPARAFLWTFLVFQKPLLNLRTQLSRCSGLGRSSCRSAAVLQPHSGLQLLDDLVMMLSSQWLHSTGCVSISLALTR
jgi:hypothetical protein